MVALPRFYKRVKAEITNFNDAPNFLAVNNDKVGDRVMSGEIQGGMSDMAKGTVPP